MRWVKNDLENRGFYIADSSQCRCKTDFFTRGGERIDVFWFDRIDQEWIFNNEVRWPVYFFDDKVPMAWNGTTIQVPYPTEYWLEYTYGKDWRTPKPGTHIRNLNPNNLTLPPK